MPFRIQLPEVSVPRDDPFKNDLLGRRQPIEVLTRLVGSLEGPCVLAIDAPWGTGKTTFLRMWENHLRNEGFAATTFNAWDTDFTGDPLLALSAELLEGIEAHGNTQIEDRIEVVRRSVSKLLQATVPSAVSAVTHGFVDVRSFVTPAERLTRYRESTDLFGHLRTDLTAIATTISESRADRPLVVLVDELDRCRPSYAVELLEIAKHLFSIRHVVFALAVNRSELEHSVQALYGRDFDAHGYLRRFFDVDFRLPEPDRDAFVDAMFDTTGIDDHLRRINSPEVQYFLSAFEGMLKEVFFLPRLSIRRVGQAIHRLGFVFASLSEHQQPLIMPIATALILRTLDAELYRGFVTGQLSGDQVIDALYRTPDGEAFRRTKERALFEAILILAQGESNSLIRKRVAEIEAQEEPGDSSAKAAWRHQRRVADILDRLGEWRTWERRFKVAVKRLELFSEDFT